MSTENAFSVLFSRNSKNFGTECIENIFLKVQDTVITLGERWSVHQGSEVGKDSYKAAGAVTTAESWVLFCIAHTSLECGKVCYFWQDKGDIILMWFTIWGMLNPCRTLRRRLLPDIVSLYTWFCFCWSSSCYSQKLFQYMLDKENNMKIIINEWKLCQISGMGNLGFEKYPYELKGIHIK